MSHALKGMSRPSLVTLAYLTAAALLAAAGLAIAAGAGPSELGAFDPSAAADQFGSGPSPESGAGLNEGGQGRTGTVDGSDGDGSVLASTGFTLSLPFFVGSLALLMGLGLRRWNSRSPRGPAHAQTSS